MIMSLQIIQHNARNLRTVTLELINYITTNNIDIALLQEPYAYKQPTGKFSIPGLNNLTLIADTDNKFLSCIIMQNKLNNKALHLRNV
jgi:hypothetical protein